MARAGSTKAAFTSIDSSGCGNITEESIIARFEGLHLKVGAQEYARKMIHDMRKFQGEVFGATEMRYHAFAAVISDYKAYDAAMKQVCHEVKHGRRALQGNKLKELEKYFAEAQGDKATFEAFHAAVVRMGVSLPPMDVQIHFKALDVDGAGFISVHELCEAVRRNDKGKRKEQERRLGIPHRG